MTSARSPFLAVRDLRTYFHRDAGFVRAVDGVSFDVPAGRTVGLAGASGSGKTQTALSILGLVDAAPGIVGGEIRVGGANLLADLDRFCALHDDGDGLVVTKDVDGWKARHARRLRSVWGRQIGMVFQEPKASLVPYLTVADHVRETIKAHGGEEARSDAEAEALLRRLRFEDPRPLLGRFPYALSGGESQRVALGLALLGRPRLLIADEPTTMLDAVTQRHVLEVLAEHVRTLDLSLLLITHDLPLLRLLVDEVVLLFAGMVVEHGPAAAVIDPTGEAGHPYTQALLRAFSGTPASSIEAHPVAAVPRQGCRYYAHCPLKDLLPEPVRRRCLHETPPMHHVGEGHRVACWARTDDR